MTAGERAALRRVRDLEVRLDEALREVDKIQARANEQRRRLTKENKRLRALVAAHATMRRQAVDDGRFWHGVVLANGLEAVR